MASMTRRGVWWWPVAVVVATQLPYPLLHGHARDALTVVTVCVFAALSTVHALVTRGSAYAAVLVLVAGIGGFAVEVLGVHTAVPFGDYRYTGGLGPVLAGVPVTVGLAWLMMAYPSTLVAARTTGARSRRAPGAVVVGAVALAGWDVFLDPQMVAAHHWRWSHPSPHLPGVVNVPLSNFGGWLLVAVVMMAVLVPLSRPARAEDAPMLALWVWMWLGSAVALGVFLGLGAAAGWGLLAMAVPGVALVARMAHR
jgi:putative membrane protein